MKKYLTKLITEIVHETLPAKVIRTINDTEDDLHDLVQSFEAYKETAPTSDDIERLRRDLDDSLGKDFVNPKEVAAELDTEALADEVMKLMDEDYLIQKLLDRIDYEKLAAALIKKVKS